ncbi:MAG: hypothetical protein U1C33_05730, partial [Candidatus Cloacimonadaceae bacterium]|nr:hypothetical protein [Candidatus Cloacimonadaceae bacterium]
MKNIIALCDYQNRFGSKYFDYPYRSGMDKDHLVKQFRKYDWNLTYVNPASLTRESHPHDVPVIYTAQEDSGYRYKSFIEDIVFGLELSGYMTLPSYKYLRANNNKIFMEILRELLLPEKYQNSSKYFGCLEELQSEIVIIEFPCVIKTAEGAGSRGVYLAKNRAEIFTIAKKVSRSMSLYHEMWDWGRRFCHNGYRRESTHRNKFIVQNYIPGLINDWKVLVFFDKYYVLRRENRPRDFRASG